MTRPETPLGSRSSPFSDPRLIALDKLLVLDAEDMSILYLSARNLGKVINLLFAPVCMSLR